MISGLHKPKRTALQGKLSSWNEAKGFGWVEAGGQRWFAHIKEFATGQRRPEPGDSVIFFAGMDERGRPRAMELRLARQKARIKVMTWLVLGGLLVLPVMAGFRLPFAPWGLPAVMAAFSLLAWVAYANDKAKARQGVWRTEESTLHWTALFGGWPGAFLAQQCYRHKTAKRSFQLIFWMIVLIHQFLAADVLLGHEPSGRLWRTIQTIRPEVGEMRASPWKSPHTLMPQPLTKSHSSPSPCALRDQAVVWPIQASIRRFGTRANSLVLCVTSVASPAPADAARHPRRFPESR